MPESVTRDRGLRLRRYGYVLEAVTLGWNVVGVVVLAVAAITARSVALGGFASDILGSQRVTPAKLTEAGFTFGYPDLEAGLQAELAR